LKLRRWPDIYRVNVEGTRRLVAAASGTVENVVVLSSMSAYEGTTQMYGRAKLLIERHAFAAGASVLRPGLVYGPNAGGMVGTLTRLARLPIVPIVAGGSYQFTVHEDDLAATVSAIMADRSRVPDRPVGVAHPQPVPLDQIVLALATWQGRPVRLFRVPWQLVYFPMEVAEVFPISLPFKSDSLLGVARPAPYVPNVDILSALGIEPRRFGRDTVDM
jgi:nucleoside-diphosphate-sugar epimerase